MNAQAFRRGAALLLSGVTLALPLAILPSCDDGDAVDEIGDDMEEAADEIGDEAQDLGDDIGD